MTTMKKEYISPTLSYFESDLILYTTIPSISDKPAGDPENDLVKEERDEWNDGLW